MTEAFPAFVTKIGGKSRRLVLERQWRRAIVAGQLERHTPVRYERNSEEARTCLAHQCSELEMIFLEILGPEGERTSPAMPDARDLNHDRPDAPDVPPANLIPIGGVRWIGTRSRDRAPGFDASTIPPANKIVVDPRR